MSPEKQQRAIAEACGWERVRIPTQSKDDPLPRGWALNGKGGWRAKHSVPDYLNDLNAMHEAEDRIEAVMHDRGDDHAYGDKLVEVTMDVRPIRATAAQRAEAFLRTLNKWEDDK